jgi:hypothetical protein
VIRGKATTLSKYRQLAGCRASISRFPTTSRIADSVPIDRKNFYPRITVVVLCVEKHTVAKRNKGNKDLFDFDTTDSIEHNTVAT